MAGIHRLEHVQRLAATHLADHDPVGTHAQGIADKIPDRHGPSAFDIGRSGFEGYNMFLPQLQFGSVFDRHDSLIRRNKRRQYVQRGGFSGAGSPGNYDIQFPFHAGFQQIRHLLRQRIHIDQIVNLEGIAGKFPDGQRGSGQGQRWNNRVDP